MAILPNLNGLCVILMLQKQQNKKKNLRERNVQYIQRQLGFSHMLVLI